MATQSAQSPDPARQMQQMAQASHTMGMSALHKSHQAMSDTHQKLVQAISSLGGGDQGGGPDPSQMQPDPGQSSEQAVWGEFPGTDPNAIDHLMQSSGGDPQGVLGPLFHLFASDEQKLAAMHQQIVDHVLTMLSAPQGPPTDQAAENPAVGGEYTGG